MRPRLSGCFGLRTLPALVQRVAGCLEWVPLLVEQEEKMTAAAARREHTGRRRPLTDAGGGAAAHTFCALGTLRPDPAHA